jgi:hypothetical protein
MKTEAAGNVRRDNEMRTKFCVGKPEDTGRETEECYQNGTRRHSVKAGIRVAQQWVQLGGGGRLLCKQKWTFRFHKDREFVG